MNIYIYIYVYMYIYIYVYVSLSLYIYIYIYVYTCEHDIFVCLCRICRSLLAGCDAQASAANLPTKIPDFRGLDSGIILILRGGINLSNLSRII